MRGKKLKILSIIFGEGVALSLLIFSMLSLAKISDKNDTHNKPTTQFYDKVYYATAEENTGSEASCAFYVTANGSVNDYNGVHHSDYAVRPAMSLKL